VCSKGRYGADTRKDGGSRRNRSGNARLFLHDERADENA
jgi:hypothetical protein